MAVINLAKKYAKGVEERFYHDSITEASFSKELDMEFHGVKSVTVYDVGTAPINDYQRSGSNRYGSPEELDDHIQEFVMTQDKSSTWTIDKGNQKEQFNIKQAAQTLKRQLRERYTPAIDKYRIQKWADGAGIVMGVNEPTKNSIVGLMLDANTAMDDAAVPESGRMFYVPAKYFKALLLSDEFTKADALLLKSLGKGTVGELFGVPVKKIPSSYLPDGVYFLEIFKGAAISPVKLQEHKIHTDPPGISGDLVEMRLIYDAFVRGTKADGILAAVDASKAVATPTITFSANVATIATTTGGATIKYTTDGSDPRYSASANVYDSGAKPTVAAGATVKAAAMLSGSYQSGVASADNV